MAVLDHFGSRVNRVCGRGGRNNQVRADLGKEGGFVQGFDDESADFKCYYSISGVLRFIWSIRC